MIIRKLINVKFVMSDGRYCIDNTMNVRTDCTDEEIEAQAYSIRSGCMNVILGQHKIEYNDFVKSNWGNDFVNSKLLITRIT